MNYPPLVQIIGAWIETVILGRQLAYKALHPLAPCLTFRKSLRSTDRQTCLTEGQGSYTVKIISSSLLLSSPSPPLRSCLSSLHLNAREYELYSLRTEYAHTDSTLGVWCLLPLLCLLNSYLCHLGVCWPCELRTVSVWFIISLSALAQSPGGAESMVSGQTEQHALLESSWPYFKVNRHDCAPPSTTEQ